MVSTIYLYKFNKELYHHFDYLAMEVADEEQEERYRQDGSHRNRGGNEQLNRLREVSLWRLRKVKIIVHISSTYTSMI